MDSKECIELIHPFINISNYLRKHDFSSPEIYEIDYINGYLLLEDFGDDTFYRYLQNYPHEINKLYKSTLDLLLVLSKIPNEHICPKYNREFLIKELSYFIDWYCPYIRINLSNEQKVNFYDIWHEIIDKLEKDTFNNVFVHKDFHGGNLLLLPNRKGIKSIGLIDYQSAKLGNEIYDLISFLYDCRMTIPEILQNNFMKYYFKNLNIDEEVFNVSCKTFIVQRNLKILGNFTNVYFTNSNSNYLKYLDNAWKLINDNLYIESLKELRKWLNMNIFKQ